MSEERLQEIKDSVDFQREILLANNLGTVCVDEEQELIDEIGRLNNIINELEKWLKDYINLIKEPDIYEEQTIEDLKEVLDKLQELKGSDKK